MNTVTNENRQIADWLRQAVDLLAAQGANPFRVSACRHAACVAHWPESVGPIHAREGRKGLDALPGIGGGLALRIHDTLHVDTLEARELDQTHDRGVVHFYAGQHLDKQHSAVTETRGSLHGQRLVRGREVECRDYYTQGPREQA